MQPEPLHLSVGTTEIDGPEAFAHHEFAAEIARATGRGVRYVPLDDDQTRRPLNLRGLPTAHMERRSLAVRLRPGG